MLSKAPHKDASVLIAPIACVKLPMEAVRFAVLVLRAPTYSAVAFVAVIAAAAYALSSVFAVCCAAAAVCARS